MTLQVTPNDDKMRKIADDLRLLDLERFREEIDGHDSETLGYVRLFLGYSSNPAESSWQVKEINRLITRRKGKFELERLERDYAFMTLALNKGGWAVGLAAALVIFVLASSSWILVSTGKTLFSGIQMTAIILFLAGSLVVYFSVIFGRSTKLSAEMKGLKISMESAD